MSQLKSREWKCSRCGEWASTEYLCHIHVEPLDMCASPKAPYTDAQGNYVIELVLRRERQIRTHRRLTDAMRSVPALVKA